MPKFHYQMILAYMVGGLELHGAASCPNLTSKVLQFRQSGGWFRDHIHPLLEPCEFTGYRYVDPFMQSMDLRNGFEMALDVCPSMELISYFESQGT